MSESALDKGTDGVHLQQEAVVPVGGCNDVKLVYAGNEVGQLPLKPQGVEAVTVDTADDHRNGDGGQRGRDAAPPPADVVGVHGIGECDVRSGVEAMDKLVGVMVEIALHGEAAVVERIFVILRGATETNVELSTRCGR